MKIGITAMKETDMEMKKNPKNKKNISMIGKNHDQYFLLG